MAGDRGIIRPMRMIGAVVVLVPLLGCGGGNGNAPASPSAGNTDATVTITSTGVSVTQLSVAQGSRVFFVNHDTKSHNMTSDPHPEHTDCPEINNAGLLQ